MNREDALKIADAILALINSRPRTPTRDQVVEIIAAALDVPLVDEQPGRGFVYAGMDRASGPDRTIVGVRGVGGWRELPSGDELMTRWQQQWLEIVEGMKIAQRHREAREAIERAWKPQTTLEIAMQHGDEAANFKPPCLVCGQYHE
jgi:hypothetical protein